MRLKKSFFWGDFRYNRFKYRLYCKKQVKDIKEFIQLININFSVVGVSNDMISKALEIKNSDFEDTLQYLSAKNQKCDCIVTNDKSFYKADIDTFSSTEFVKHYL